MFTSSMFESIKAALAKNDNSNAVYKEVLKLEPGKTYVVRLLPVINESGDASKTFFHYFMHGWTSFSNGQYVQALSLQTFKERDPIADERYRLLKLGTDEEKKKAETVIRSEKWLANVYVIDDPTRPENNGQVKIIRYGRQLAKIIQEAIDGEDSEEVGPRAFDLSKEGVNLKIKVERQGEYPSYVSSKFTNPVDLKLSKQQQDEIYGKVHNLEKVVNVKSADELTQMWQEHFVCSKTKVSTVEAPTTSKGVVPAKVEDAESFVSSFDFTESAESEPSESLNTTSKYKSLIAGLDD